MGYNIGYDIVVDESESEAFGFAYEKRTTTFEKKLGDYLGSLDRILVSAVKSGQVADNLETFKQEANTLKSEVEQLSNRYKEKVSPYNAAIDAADKELY
ncbi:MULTISPECIES: hypothetical protein [unclassified Enterococcus]|uniref:hypothetical protein n=1 Tax=unclassified Enterococcus TaxID=2608891 RepID=UPI001CE12F94|nr:MULTISPECIES: hypothetical protein [unclassified Enterococcus]MCA5014128.1 hypothetical protein [Enterococcus sp. S23]MCA5017652.1 hypothetical protein [Enterococcus sp. S22(2020)]